MFEINIHVLTAIIRQTSPTVENNLSDIPCSDAVNCKPISLNIVLDKYNRVANISAKNVCLTYYELFNYQNMGAVKGQET